MLEMASGQPKSSFLALEGILPVRIEVAADHKFQVWTNSLPLVHVWDWGITTGILQALCGLWR